MSTDPAMTATDGGWRTVADDLALVLRATMLRNPNLTPRDWDRAHAALERYESAGGEMPLVTDRRRSGDLALFSCPQALVGGLRRTGVDAKALVTRVAASAAVRRRALNVSAGDSFSVRSGWVCRPGGVSDRVGSEAGAGDVGACVGVDDADGVDEPAGVAPGGFGPAGRDRPRPGWARRSRQLPLPDCVGQVGHPLRRLRADRLQGHAARVHALEQADSGAEQHG